MTPRWLTPFPTGFVCPLASNTGGHASVQAPEQLLLLSPSLTNRYTVIPVEVARIGPQGVFFSIVIVVGAACAIAGVVANANDPAAVASAERGAAQRCETPAGPGDRLSVSA